MVPQRMGKLMLDKNPDMAKQYGWNRPHISPTIKTVNGYDAVMAVVSDSHTFATPYEDRVGSFTDGYGFYVGSNNISKNKRDHAMVCMSPPIICNR